MFIPQATPIQPINVIVRQAVGMPEWVRILISAGAGAVFGILGSLATEYVKPCIVTGRMEKLISIHLNQEFLENLGELEAAGRILADANERTNSDKDHALMAVDEILRRVRQDRYDLYFRSEKSVVYKIDRSHHLSLFYSTLNREPKRVPPTSKHIETMMWMNLVVSRGKKYLEGAGLKYEPEPNPNESVYHQLRMAEESGRGNAVAGRNAGN
jgi:hypothetical protein